MAFPSPVQQPVSHDRKTRPLYPSYGFKGVTLLVCFSPSCRKLQEEVVKEVDNLVSKKEVSTAQPKYHHRQRSLSLMVIYARYMVTWLMAVKFRYRGGDGANAQLRA